MNAPSLVPAPSGVVLQVAAPGQVAAALALLPGLLREDVPATVAPPRLWVCHDEARPLEPLAAAGFWPQVHGGGARGFRLHMHVQPERRRRGLGRALLAAVSREVRAWDVFQIVAPEVPAGGPADAFLAASGFHATATLHHFLAHVRDAGPVCLGLAERLRRRRRVPDGFDVVDLRAVPLAAVVDLHHREFSATPEGAQALLKRTLADPVTGPLSVGLWNGHTLAGYLLAGLTDGLPDLRFWASPPQFRQGWAAALLLAGYVERFAREGHRECRFHCNDGTRATLNMARKTQAALLKVVRLYVRDLPP